MPLAPQTLEMRVLQRACELLGSERSLARRLRVPMPALFMWLKGTEKPPRALFMEAVDILIAHDASVPGDIQLVNPDGAASPAAPDRPEES